MKIKILSIFISLTLLTVSILSGNIVTASKIKKSDNIISETPYSYIIEGVPYIGQETSFFCAYASFTMLINSFNHINTSLQDVVYYSGMGYSLTYPDFMKKRMSISGVYSSQSPGDIKFLTGLFGLSPKSWNPIDGSIPEDKYWQEYWIRVKENISSNVPVLTSVNPFKLSSFRSILNLPDLFWDIFQSGGHAIVIVGYNESNSSVCYHDPALALFGLPEYGKYAWMNLADFNEAVLTTEGLQYAVLTFEQTSDPLSKKDAFNKSHLRNLEKIKGNTSAYSEYFVNLTNGSEYGINGLKLMQKHYEIGFENRFKTILFYKNEGKLGIFYRSIKSFAPIVAKILNLPPDIGEKFFINNFEVISIEKCWMAGFLKNNTELSNVCEYEAMLFENEARLWDELSSLYSVFQKRGITLSLPRAFFVINQMSGTVDKIIEIEEAISQSEIVMEVFK